MFTCITWCPKATVQAALSTVALDYVTDSANRREFDDDGGDTDYEKNEEFATVVLTVAVLSIILTAPAFAVAMKYTGENWLVKSEAPAPGAQPALAAAASDGIGAGNGYDPEEPVSITLGLGRRKDTLTTTLGDRKISLGGGLGGGLGGAQQRGFRVPTITKTDATPAGVRPRVATAVYNNTGKPAGQQHSSGSRGLFGSSGGGGGGAGGPVRRRSNTAPGRSSYEGPAPAIEFTATDNGNANGNANANANANGSSDVAGALEPRQARTNRDVV